MENLERLILELCKLDNETEWVEFKHNNYDPFMIGNDISALANSATLHEKQKAYMLWGIHDKTHEIVGTDYDLQSLKKGQQEIGSWLRSLLSDNADFEFHTVTVNEDSILKDDNIPNNTKIGVLIIYKATNTPVVFQNVDYIRVGSYTKKLYDYPALQSQLWDRLHNTNFEELDSMSDLDLKDALQKLDYTVYFDLKNEPVPTDIDGIAHYMLEENIIRKQDNGLYSITNLGSILFSKKISEFARISRKAVRVVQYEGKSKLNMLKEHTCKRGYAAEFEEIIQYIEALLPSKEIIDGALRRKQTVYPTIAIREAVANALIHQDFSITGAGPVIEIFENRIEITNPGNPLVDINRIIDNPPKSRNEALASLMRRLRVCEELGTGWDKIAINCELHLLPAPKIEQYDKSTKVTLYADIPFSNISPEDKVWACYLHACIKHVQGECLTNQSLRERFGLPKTSSASISRLIKDVTELKIIKPLDPTTAPRYMKYIPYWA